MTYSFTVRESDKEKAKARVAAEFDIVVGQHEAHVQDRAQAQAAVFSFIDALEEDLNHDVFVNVSGHVTWRGDFKPSETPLIGINIMITASLTNRE